MAKKAGIIWVDAQSQKVLHVITSLSGVGPIESALSNHSQAAVIECWEGNDEFYTVVPGTGQYPTVRVTAQLNFQSATGSAGRLFLPAPDNIFLSDGITVDPSLIPDIITAALGNLLCGDGTPATMFTGGQLIQTKFSGLTTTY